MLLEDDGTAQVIFSYGDDLLNQSRDGTTSFFHYDGLGSTRSLSDSSGNLTDTYNYEAFGELLNLTGTTDNNYLFAGEQLDANLEQYYLRARYYDQGIGRFTQIDKFDGIYIEPQSLHKYLYGESEPVNNIDPSGNISLSSIGATLRVNGQLARTSIATGRSQINRFLVRRVTRGNGDNLGFVGNMIKEYAREAFLDVLLSPIQSQASKTVQGTFAHTGFEKKIKGMKDLFNKKFKRFNLTIDAEVFFVDKNGRKSQSPRRAKGSLGLDVVISQGGKPVLAFDLKTGSPMSKSRVKKLKKRFRGADIFEIIVSVKRPK